MRKKNLDILFIVVLALLLIALVVWYYDRRIKEVEDKNRNHSSLLNTQK